MSIAEDEAMELFRAEHQYDLREAYVRGREAEPADAEIEAVARRLLWRSCEWNGIDGDYAAKDEEDAWDYAGEILGWREGFIERARDLLETSRKAVTES